MQNRTRMFTITISSQVLRNDRLEQRQLTVPEPEYSKNRSKRSTGNSTCSNQCMKVPVNVTFLTSRDTACFLAIFRLDSNG
jgi:hypothetical protein